MIKQRHQTAASNGDHNAKTVMTTVLRYGGNDDIDGDDGNTLFTAVMGDDTIDGGKGQDNWFYGGAGNG